MKTKLLFFFSLLSLIGFAQAPIASYYGTNGSHFAVMTGNINQSATGANLTWNFNNMEVIDESHDVETVPTAAELSDFPGSTKVITTNTIGINATTKLYSKAPSNNLSITGAANSGVLLNYNTNNANLGTFPLNYGNSNSDPIAGSYDNGQYSGTFSGTIVTTVDAYGTLNLGSGGVTTISTTATRLKTLQTLSLNYGIFSNIGTITITTYSYYGSDTPVGVPRFRTTQTVVNVPLLSINDTFSTMEAYTFTELGTQDFDRSEFAIVPNPCESTLNISSKERIRVVKLTDMTGKTVLIDHSQSLTIEVGHLQKGIYFANIQTDSGSTVKKFIKK